MTNYYLRFLEDYARTSEPLCCLLKKGVPGVWSTDCQSAFHRLKQHITSEPIFAHFSLEATTFVTCDASATAIGAALPQEQGGVERHAAFASRALSSAEQQYSAGERETLACVRACEKWHLFLYGRQFRLRTDHQAIVSLLSVTETGHRPLRLHRWTERLCRYSLQMEYRPGNCNQVADLLSRFHAAEEEQILEPLEDEKCVLMLGAWSPGITAEHLDVASREDKQLAQVSQYAREGWPSHPLSENLRAYWQVRGELAPLVPESSCVMRGARVIVPGELLGRVLELAHKGHLGIVRKSNGVEISCGGRLWIDRLNSL